MKTQTSLKTYKEWIVEGRVVRNGEKPHGWTWNNYAVYYFEQTQALK